MEDIVVAFSTYFGLGLKFAIFSRKSLSANDYESITPTKISYFEVGKKIVFILVFKKS
jgi:hypothetical protein